VPALAPAERGATIIRAEVVARIAARAAYEALTRQTGAPPARRGLTAPSSSADVRNGSACLRVSLDLPYPLDINRAAREMRRYIADRVTQLTGIRVDDLTLTVQRLVAAESQQRGRVR